MRFIFSYIRPHWKILLLTLFLTTVNQFFSLMDPQVLRWLMDKYLTNPSIHTPQAYLNGILLWLVWLVSVAMISRLAKNFQDYFVNVMTQNIWTEIYQKTIAHTFQLPFQHFEEQQSWELIQKLLKAKESLQTYIAGLISIVFLACVGIIIVVGYSFLVDWRIWVVYLGLLPIIWWTTMKLSKSIKQAQTSISTQSNALAWSITESIRNISLIKMLWLVGQELRRIDTINTDILTLELEKVKKVRTMEFLQWTLINALRVWLIWFLWYLVFQGDITVWELLSLYFYSFFLFGQLGQFGQVTKSYQEAQANHELLNDILSLPQEDSDEHHETLTTLRDIRCSWVDFGYEEDRHILRGISLAMHAWDTIAFVWPSGSGKSTLLKIILWLYTPQAWTVLYNWLPLNQINLTHFKQHIGIVTQETQVFSGTIRENLLFVAPHADEQAMIDVMKQAALYDFLQTLPAWLDTSIGEWWIKLSWWQKQRLAIARALLRNPLLLIFDEATSALDSLTEQEITDTIAQITAHRPEMITILVAHRLSSVRHATQINVLAEWSIIEQWTHNDLIANNALYASLRQQQIWKKS